MGHSGTTTVEEGTLALAGDGVIGISPLIDVRQDAVFDVSGVTGGTYSLAVGQAIIGDGTVQGNLNVVAGSDISAGASPGHLTISGDYSQGGTLLAELGGTAQGSPTGYDWISVGGTATFESGALIDVDLYGGFTPQIGNVFDILTAAGGIANVDLSDVEINFDGAPSLAVWTTEIVSLGGTAEALRISSVPEPASLVTLVLGLLAALGLTRRRGRPRAQG